MGFLYFLRTSSRTLSKSSARRHEPISNWGQDDFLLASATAYPSLDTAGRLLPPALYASSASPATGPTLRTAISLLQDAQSNSAHERPAPPTLRPTLVFPRTGPRVAGPSSSRTPTTPWRTQGPRSSLAPLPPSDLCLPVSFVSMSVSHPVRVRVHILAIDTALLRLRALPLPRTKMPPWGGTTRDSVPSHTLPLRSPRQDPAVFGRFTLPLPCSYTHCLRADDVSTRTASTERELLTTPGTETVSPTSLVTPDALVYERRGVYHIRDAASAGSQRAWWGVTDARREFAQAPLGELYSRFAACKRRQPLATLGTRTAPRTSFAVSELARAALGGLQWVSSADEALVPRHAGMGGDCGRGSLAQDSRRAGTGKSECEWKEQPTYARTLPHVRRSRRPLTSSVDPRMGGDRGHVERQLGEARLAGGAGAVGGGMPVGMEGAAPPIQVLSTYGLRCALAPARCNNSYIEDCSGFVGKYEARTPHHTGFRSQERGHTSAGKAACPWAQPASC
ncbi:hypothetical protein DFH06DRAFT_1484502 [Mycena polygramma]|nr:hypothetical protein DFH06DRAFT_1484502 [Mycena polygramma]